MLALASELTRNQAFAILGACLLVYLIPSFVALVRGHENVVSIIVVNVLLGGTLVGWAVAMAWACASQRPQRVHVVGIGRERRRR